jgi:hypothetical protein
MLEECGTWIASLGAPRQRLADQRLGGRGALMGGLFGGGTISNEAEKLAAIRIQTSAYGRVIPVVYGTARIAGNLLWKGDFVRTANTTQQKSGGVFGIGAVKVQNTTYTYSAAIALGLCEGPITGIGIMWSEKAFDTFANAVATFGFLLFTGVSPQSVWSWLTTKHPNEAIPYDGIAFVANPSWPLDGNASLPNMSFEVGGFCQVGGGNVDANTAVVISDILTNQRYGRAGIRRVSTSPTSRPTAPRLGSSSRRRTRSRSRRPR